MKCLLVRQPYASLISHGLKRIEFRNRPTTPKGIIAIAASRGRPIKTSNKLLNEASEYFPRGKILALADLHSNVFYDNKKLSELFTGSMKYVIHDVEIELANQPLGEPLSDILEAINDHSWWSYGWHLLDIRPLKEPLKMERRSYGPWINLNDDETNEISYHISSNS